MLGKLEKLTEKEPTELGEEVQKAEEGLACCSDMGWIPLLPTFCPNMQICICQICICFF